MGLVSNGVFDNFDNFEKAAVKSKEFKIEDNEIIVDTTDFSKVDFNSIISNIKKYNKNMKNVNGEKKYGS